MRTVDYLQVQGSHGCIGNQLPAQAEVNVLFQNIQIFQTHPQKLNPWLPLQFFFTLRHSGHTNTNISKPDIDRLAIYSGVTRTQK